MGHSWEAPFAKEASLPAQVTSPALSGNRDAQALFPLIDALPKYLSAKQAAFILDLTPAEVRSRVRKGNLTGRTIGSQVFVEAQAVRVAYHALRAISRAA